MFDLSQNINKIKTSKHGIVKKKDKQVIIVFKIPTTSAKFSVKPEGNLFTLEAQVTKGYPCVMSCNGLFDEGSILIQKNLLKLSLNIPPKLIGSTLNFQLYPQGASSGRTELHIHSLCISTGGIVKPDLELEEEEGEEEEVQEARKILEKLEQMEELIQQEEIDNMTELAKLAELVHQEKMMIRDKNKVDDAMEPEVKGGKVDDNMEKLSTQTGMDGGPELSGRILIERLGVKDILKRLKKSEKNLIL